MIIRQYNDKGSDHKENKTFQLFKVHTNGRYTRLSKNGGSGLGHWTRREVETNTHMNHASILSFYFEIIK
jgi:signal transduction histidine kinase